ncbi:MAG: hypothetical protein EU539_07025 [Promethearchaeota archaeon]|nr:MAG: hypothetical protein EU539_07025 [Candidatus Lokiarchaeota archaeon]
MLEKPTIGLDYSHNNKLTLEATSYSDFTNYLFTSGYKLGKIEAGFVSKKKLEVYDMIILSSPKNDHLSENEIEVLENYVKNGGCLLVISSMGGDYTNRTNLNELTQKFGFEFQPDEIHDSVNYVYLQKRPLITEIIPHVISDQIRKLVFSSACSLKILDFIEDEQNISIEVIAIGGLNTWHKIYDGTRWVEEDCPKIPLIVSVDYYDGRVVGFGNLSCFSSLSHEYGFSAFDNNILIANLFKWLASGMVSSGKMITVNLNLNLFNWATKILRDQDWESASDIINVALKYFKDNYQDIIENIKEIQEEKLKRKKEHEMSENEIAEEEILKMIPVRKKEDLIEIMSALEEITGEKYELSINLDEEEIFEIEVDDEILEYSEQDVDQFNKETSKNAIWHGKETKAFIEWLNQKK